jgi:hypothetical protein
MSVDLTEYYLQKARAKLAAASSVESDAKTAAEEKSARAAKERSQVVESDAETLASYRKEAELRLELSSLKADKERRAAYPAVVEMEAAAARRSAATESGLSATRSARITAFAKEIERSKFDRKTKVDMIDTFTQLVFEESG